MKFKYLVVVSLLIVTVSAFVSPKKSLRTFISNYENVLGTSLELKFKTTNQVDADLAEQNVLNEIDRLDNILSAYKSTSEFNKWIKNGRETTKISSELFEVLQQFENYKGLTNGALDVSAEVITKVWKKAAVENRLPSTSELQNAVTLVKQTHYVLDKDNQTVTRLDEAPLALNSFAKSYIINKAAEKAIHTSGIENVVVNIGGDMVIKGAQPENIEIADPKADAENDAALATIKVSNMAVATSGNYRRGFNVNGKWYSHIVDPRTGNPVSKIISATVIAPNASEAGALATSFNILSVKEIEKLASSRNSIEYLLILKNGTEIKSKGWSKYEIKTDKAIALNNNSSKADKLWDTKYELIVNLEIAQIEGMRVRRPFVAVWVEDATKKSVRNLAIWYNKPRWLPDLKSWTRSNGDEFKKGAEGKLSSTSSATRGPGKYSLAWDGKDDSGNLVKAGTYTVYIEVAREHGTYQIISKEMKFTGSAKKIELTPNTELASASLDYRKIAAKKNNTIAVPVGLGKKAVKKINGKGKGKKRLAGLSRWLHIYLSMVSFTILLFFAVSGLTLNHADWFTSGKEVITKDSGKMDVRWVNQLDPTKLNKLQVVEFLRSKHDVKGTLNDFRIEEHELSLTFNGPGYVADSFIDRETGKYELTITRLGTVAVINDLHKGRDSGKAWSWIIDISAVLMTLVSISGIILICFIKKKRLSGFIIVALGTLVCYLIYKLFVP